MLIKKENEVNITIKELHDILDISYNKCHYLYDEIINLILRGELNNNRKDIIDYISRK